MRVTIYHNPRCSKSRQVLEMIRVLGGHHGPGQMRGNLFHRSPDLFHPPVQPAPLAQHVGRGGWRDDGVKRDPADGQNHDQTRAPKQPAQHEPQQRSPFRFAWCSGQIVSPAVVVVQILPPEASELA